MFGRLVVCALVLCAVGCAKESNKSSAAGSIASAQASRLATMPAPVSVRGAGHGFANAPDRGQLLAYPGKDVQQRGAYTWHRTSISEAYAMRAITDGHMTVTTPDGEVLEFQYDRHIEHPSGDWTWVGHRAGHDIEQMVLTFGEHAVFGTIAQSDKPALRLAMRDGASWLVETDPEKLARVKSAAAHPGKPDYMIVPKPASPPPAHDPHTMPAAARAMASAAATTAPTIDVVIGYTVGWEISVGNGNPSIVATRLNYLIDVANTAYFNSKLSGQIRLVGTTYVGGNYPDNTSNELALEQLSGYKVGTGKTTPATVFNDLRWKREHFGGDLVVLIRKFNDPENGGCGVGWLIGGGKQSIEPGDGWDYLGYSVVSDGADGDFFCEDQTLAHELGHNMGLAHDRENAKGDNGVLDDPEDYGAFDYSFGYKKDTASGGFYDVMAYGDAGQTSYNVFSNPRVTLCDGQPCGVDGSHVGSSADAALSLSKTMPIIATFRATVVPMPARNDIDGDGITDLMFRYNKTASGNFRWQNANATGVNAQDQDTVGISYRPAATGDFNNDGLLDIMWTADSNRTLILGRGDIYRIFPKLAAGSYGAGWSVAGAGDIDGDRKSDLLLRYNMTASNNFSYWIMNGPSHGRIGYDTIGASWRIAATGDFNGDGKLDILWSADSTRTLNMWLGNGTSFVKSSIGTYGVGWSVVGAGDIDGDGKSDLLLRYYQTASNNFSYWIMDGTSRTRIGYDTIGSSWHVATTSDFNADGKLDIMWAAESTHALARWQGNGTSFAKVQTSSPLYTTGWSIVY